jgi:two-component system, sensor histidine kinase and response regulator
VAAHSYDAVLMDCQMPELNGYEATAAIRALKSSGRLTPVIAMTAGARPEDRERCLAEGMDAYVSKPVSKDALLSLVARSVRNGGPEIYAPPSGAHNVTLEVVMDREVVDELRLLGEPTGDEFLADIVGQFVTDTELRLLDLRSAIEIDDAPVVARIAHGIKGSSDQLGGRRLALACSRLEGLATADSLLDGKTILKEIDVEFQDLCRALARAASAPAREETRASRG